jgi:hypothetical protein
VESLFPKAACEEYDFYIEHSPVDGIPYWDTGAQNLHKLENYLDRPAQNSLSGRVASHSSSSG